MCINTEDVRMTEAIRSVVTGARNRCLTSHPTAVIKHWPTWRAKGLFGFTGYSESFESTSHRSQSRNSNRTWLKWTGIWRQKVNRGCGESLLNGFLKHPRDHVPSRGTTHSELSSSTSSNVDVGRGAPQACLKASIMATLSQLRFLFQVTLAMSS